MIKNNNVIIEAVSRRCPVKQKQPPKVFCKKGVLRTFAKFTGNHLCQVLFFNKVAGFVNFAKFLGTPFSQNSSGWLLLKKVFL